MTLTIPCRTCHTELEATRVTWYADDHDGADLVAECPEHGTAVESE